MSCARRTGRSSDCAVHGWSGTGAALSVSFGDVDGGLTRQHHRKHWNCMHVHTVLCTKSWMVMATQASRKCTAGSPSAGWCGVHTPFSANVQGLKFVPRCVHLLHVNLPTSATPACCSACCLGPCTTYSFAVSAAYPTPHLIHCNCCGTTSSSPINRRTNSSTRNKHTKRQTNQTTLKRIKTSTNSRVALRRPHCPHRLQGLQ